MPIAVVHFRHGLAHARMGDLTSAAKAYRAALARDDSKAQWHTHLASTLSKTGDWPDAAAAYEAALVRDDSKAAWHYRLGHAREKMADWPDAAAAYEAALLRDDSQAAWHHRLAHARENMADWPGAAAAYEAALARDDSRAEWHYLLGVARTELEEWDDAIAAYDAALARDDRNAFWHAKRGLALMRSGRWGEAAAAYSNAILRDHSHVEWHASLARSSEQLGDWSRAVETYRVLFDRDTDHVFYRSRLGNCLGLDGHEAEAEKLLEPLACVADEVFDAHLSVNGVPRRHARSVVYVPGSLRTLLARKVTIDTVDGSRAYFEQLKRISAQTDRLSDFYTRLRQVLGKKVPRWIPPLRHDAICSRYRYFVFDFIDGETNAFPVHPEDAIDVDLGLRVADCLVDVAQRLHGLFDGDLRALGVPGQLGTIDTDDYLACEIKRASSLGEDHASLRKAHDNWQRHAAALEALPSVMSHGDVHDHNVIREHDGELRLIDWENYGWAPIGCDLVWAYRQHLDRDELEPILDRYFDGLAPNMSAAERRYCVALLAVPICGSASIRLPKKWADALA